MVREVDVTVDEQRIRRSLEEQLGMDEAAYLTDRPIGGWAQLVTDRSLELHLAALGERLQRIEDRLNARIEVLRHEITAQTERGFRRQTWALLGVSISGFAAVLAALVATA